MGTLEGMLELAQLVSDRGSVRLVEEMIEKNTMLATHIKSQVEV